jgi:hypothetical protein
MNTNKNLQQSILPLTAAPPRPPPPIPPRRATAAPPPPRPPPPIPPRRATAAPPPPRAQSQSLAQLLPPSGAEGLTLTSTITPPVELEEPIKAVVPQGPTLVPPRATLMNRIMGGRKSRLRSAIDFGHLQLVKDLVARGAEVNPLTGKKFWADIPVMWAASKGSMDILRFLVEDAGADVNITDKYGQTALMKSSENADLKVMRLLAEHGADVNATDKFGRTALIYAVKRGTDDSRNPYLDVVRYLCLHGADPNIIDKYGKKAIDYVTSTYLLIQKILRNILLEGCPPMKSTYTSTEGGYRRRSKTKRNHHRNKQTKRIARK